ncbi:hypothetical protein BX600DRAFT_431837 [Xylariales sp. PMI_506]|nr:hypothetical protein BX600DRAFT_431837 [Xylariales sp. PMI_506]
MINLTKQKNDPGIGLRIFGLYTYRTGIEGVRPDDDSGHNNNNVVNELNRENGNDNDSRNGQGESKENTNTQKIIKYPTGLGTALQAWETFNRWRFYEGHPSPKEITESFRKAIDMCMTVNLMPYTYGTFQSSIFSSKEIVKISAFEHD